MFSKTSKLTFKAAYKLVAPSNFMKVRFKEHGYETVLIPNMLNIKNYQFSERVRSKASLFWLRSFRKHYNPILAVKVLHELLLKGVDADLIMVGPDSGDGSLAEVIEFIQSHDLVDCVKIPGLLSKQEWIEISEDRTILLNTTNIDNTPISVIECMGLGINIISTNVGGIPYLLEDENDALLVPPDDKELMTNAVQKLLSEPELASTLSRNARRKVESFDWNVVKQQWNDVLTNAG